MNPTYPSADAEQVQLQVLNQLTPILQLSPTQLYANFPVGQNRTIRLLDLDDLPSKSDTDETPLVGTLRVVSLLKKPRFTALSYVWGTSSTPHPDTLELRHSGGRSVKLEISTNCRDALRALRRKYGALRIWVDAICINQHNDPEKASQILLMEDIFSRATVVYAWLGPGTDASDRVMNWTNQFAQHDFINIASATYPPTLINRFGSRCLALYLMIVYYSRVIMDTGLAWTLLPVRLGKMVLLRQPRSQDISRRLTITGNIMRRLNVFLRQDDLYDLLNREWFWRAWTFQELILAPNVVLICGHNHLEWTKVVTSFMMYTTAARIPLPGDLDHRTLFTSIRAPWDDSKHFTVPGPILDLINVWMHTERTTKRKEQQEPRVFQSFTYASWLQGTGQEALELILMFSFVLLSILWETAVLSFLVYFLLIFFPAMNIGIVIILACPVGLGIFSVSSLYFPWHTLVLCLRPDFRGDSKTYLAGVLQAIRTRHATNDKDRSYAAYGALQRLGIRELSSPDYSKPLGQVYRELTRDMLRYNPTLIHLLMDAGISTSMGGPSWVPDWRIAAGRQWVRTNYIINPPELAATPSSAAWAEFRGNNKLVVRGIQHGVIKSCSGRFHRIRTSGRDPTSSADIWTATLMLTRWVANLIRDATNLEVYRPISNVVAKVLAADIDSKAGLDLTGEDFFTWYKVMTCGNLAFEERASIGFSPEHSENDAIGPVYDSHPQGGVAKHMTIQINNHLAGRRNLFITTNGFAGSGPDAMRPGDTVMLIAGIPVPMILRRVVSKHSETSGGKYYRIIGPAYIYGLMKGEGFGTYTQNITLV
ncbi:heterokaryon incompatibility protein-domain-containing protein [Hypoxylon sp. NC0597]|nr:heterokaryon incompatibility protein-domain-containing protein [Hypoxylon sp. NC0597]